jgi:hypothetical protein
MNLVGFSNRQSISIERAAQHAEQVWNYHEKPAHVNQFAMTATGLWERQSFTAVTWRKFRV